jgi:hypothetical protein
MLRTHRRRRRTPRLRRHPRAAASSVAEAALAPQKDSKISRRIAAVVRARGRRLATRSSAAPHHFI